MLAKLANATSSELKRAEAKADSMIEEFLSKATYDRSMFRCVGAGLVY
jgi:hypothetical protein